MKGYSFKGLTGVFSHPIAGVYNFRGQVGLGQITISNSTERTTHDVAADGGIQVTYVAGDNANVTLEMQQTSDFHKFLLAWANIIKTAADSGDVSGWAAAEMHLRETTNGAVHNLLGVSPGKIPDKTYAQQGGRITWTLMAADAQQA